VPQISFDVLPGDLFVLHSDGIYEARNAAEEVYGLDRLAAFVDAQPHDVTAEQLRDALVADVERFRGGVAQADDVTIVVARVMA
jgi:serine phosphatase RsbU (regulator of sigma subunit)